MTSNYINEVNALLDDLSSKLYVTRQYKYESLVHVNRIYRTIFQSDQNELIKRCMCCERCENDHFLRYPNKIYSVQHFPGSCKLN